MLATQSLPSVHSSSQENGPRLNIEFVLFIMLFGVIFLLRITDLHYNTLFVDEAIYANVGKAALANDYSQNATTWMYGSYLYPWLATYSSQFGGVAGLRISSALLSTLAALLVFSTTARLFGSEAAFWAFVLFGLTGTSLSVGQLATYDALSIPLQASAFYCIVAAASATGRRTGLWLLISASSLSLSILAKYLAILHLPAIALIGFALFKLKGKSIIPLFSYFAVPLTLIVGTYVFHYSSDLLTLFGNRVAFTPSERSDIARTLWEDIGVVLIVAIISLGWLGRIILRVRAHWPRWRKWLLIAYLLGLAATLFAVPLYHLGLKNAQSISKHTVYTLIFIAPAIGCWLSILVGQIRSAHSPRAMHFRIIGAIIMVIAICSFVGYSLDRHWGFQRSWPNTTETLTYLQTQKLTPQHRILADGAHIYAYYFNFDRDTDRVWISTWYLEYQGLQGKEAMVKAIQDRWFDLVILDGFHAPDLSADLERALENAHYTLGHESELQHLTIGRDVVIRVYHKPAQAILSR